LLAIAGAAALSLTALGPVAPAWAAPVPAGGFADAAGVIVDVAALAGNAPVQRTLVTSSQSCPGGATAPASDNVVNQSVPTAAPRVQTVTTIAGANCAGPSAVASAETQGVEALALVPTVPIPGLPTGPLVTADTLRAQANSSCTAAPNAAGTTIVGLTIAGEAIPADVPPNTRRDIPGVATVIINEQHPAAGGRGIVVNALHIIGASDVLRGDIIFSHAVSGVVCPNGAGAAVAPGLTRPDITFTKTASPSTAKAGDTVTYTATVTNSSANACAVLRLVDHLDRVFTPVSTRGGFGSTLVSPAPTRADGGVDAVVRPAGLTLGAGQSLTQTFVVTLKGDVRPGTYYNNLELFCSTNGDFASGPLAPVTVPAPLPSPVAVPIAAPADGSALQPGGQPTTATLPRTGGAPLVAVGALLLLAAAVGLRRALPR
jgi:uncharacterized repeat protein (TIGR01451 family)